MAQDRGQVGLFEHSNETSYNFLTKWVVLFLLEPTTAQIHIYHNIFSLYIICALNGCNKNYINMHGT
jgi:hypothetical protein